MKKLYRIWFVLLIISGGCAAWFSGNATLLLWKFLTLRKEAPALVSHFEAQPLSNGRFGIEASYAYAVDGIEYQGKFLFDSPQFLNKHAAEKYSMFLFQKQWSATYNPWNPNVSALDKKFPYKHAIYALITLSVFFYFYLAKNLIQKQLLPNPK